MEFHKPYIYMLKSDDEINNNNDNVYNNYRYRLISNIFLNNNNFNPNNEHYLYIFGLFPCKYMPSAYIPFNYKKILQNINRIDYSDGTIYNNEFNSNKQIVTTELKNKIKQFINKDSIYNKLNLSYFATILIFFWSIILLLLNYVVLYYYRSSFNYILAIILFILLIFSVIWKIIYTVQN